LKEDIDKNRNNQTKQIKSKCRYWPLCKTKNCRFVHPTKTCPKFPNCWFGDNCLDIHPSVTCRFGANCMNPKCNFKHPGMHMMGNPMASQMRGGYMNMMPFQQFPMGGMMNHGMMRQNRRSFKKFRTPYNEQLRKSSENIQVVDPNTITNLNS
jgi:hypothetical protein